MTTPDPPASGGTSSAKAIRDAVNAYGRVPAAQQPAYRSRVIAMARRSGHLDLVPNAWLSGRPGTPANVGGGN